MPRKGFLDVLKNVLLLLNILAVGAGALGLMLDDRWYKLGIGIAYICLSNAGIALLLTPRNVLAAFALNWSDRNSWPFAVPFALVTSAYTCTVFGLWCYLMVTNLVEPSGLVTTAVELVWAYGVSVSPLNYLTNKPTKYKENARFAEKVAAFFAQISLVAMAAIVLVAGPGSALLLPVCIAIMAAGALTQTLVAALALQTAARA